MESKGARVGTAVRSRRRWNHPAACIASCPTPSRDRRTRLPCDGAELAQAKTTAYDRKLMSAQAATMSLGLISLRDAIGLVGAVLALTAGVVAAWQLGEVRQRRRVDMYWKLFDVFTSDDIKDSASASTRSNGDSSCSRSMLSAKRFLARNGKNSQTSTGRLSTKPSEAPMKRRSTASLARGFGSMFRQGCSRGRS